MWEEQREATKTAKKATLRIMKSEGAMPEQVLRAAELLAQIGKWRAPAGVGDMCAPARFL